jgi:hypothetical protein
VAVLDPVSVTHARRQLERISGARVSPNLFGLLGVAPELAAPSPLARPRHASGRAHQPPFLAIAPFGRPALFATVLIDGQPSRIIGVLPDTLAQAGFTADVWSRTRCSRNWETRRAASGAGSWFVIGRLRAAVATEAAERELDAILQGVDPPPPTDAARRSVRIVPLREQVTGPRSRAVVWLLTGAALLVWLVAAVNVAGLALARGVAGLPQLAIRLALGASRARLARSLLAESLTLAASAGIIGLAVALGATRAIARSGRPRRAPRGRPSRRAQFVWAVAVSALTGVWWTGADRRHWRRDLLVTGVDDGRRTAASGATRVRRLFVVSQCAACRPVAGAGLLVRSWWNDRSTPGSGEGVVSLNIAPPADLPQTQLRLLRHRARTRRAHFGCRARQHQQRSIRQQRRGARSSPRRAAIAPMRSPAPAARRDASRLRRFWKRAGSMAFSA